MASGKAESGPGAPVESDAFRVPLNAGDLLDRVTDAICVLDQGWRYRYVNRRYAELVAALGKSRKDLYGRVVWDLFPELIGTRFHAETMRAVTEGSPTEYTEYFAPLDAWFEVRVFPTPDGLISSARDVTVQVRDREALARARAESEERSESLRASEAKFRAVFEQAAVGMARVGLDGRWLDVNDCFAKMLGYSPAELKTLTFAEITHPAERVRDLGAARRMRAGELERYRVEKRYLRKDGSSFWARLTATMVLEAADGGYFVSVIEDIDAEVRRRERGRMLVEAGNLVAQALDPAATLEAIARLAVGTAERPGLADGCLITLATPDGGFQHATVASIDPAKARLEAEIERRYPLPPDAPHAYAAVIRTGRSELVPPAALAAEVLPAIARDAEHLELLSRLDMYSGLCVPLVARERVLGALTLVLHGPGRRAPLDDDDLASAEELARRAALALDNARLYTAATATNEELSAANAALEAQARQLADQARQVELANAQLQDQALELEAQAEELQATAAQLEERTEEAEQAERSAQTARQQLARTFEQAPVAVAVLEGPTHVFTLANPLYEAVAGRQALLGRTIREAFPELAGQGIYELLDRVYETGEPFVGTELRVSLRVRPDAEPEDRAFTFIYHPLRDEGGTVTGIAVVATDVTAQVRAREAVAESERQLRTLADAIPTLAWTARADGYIDWYNARWYEYTGTTPAQMEGWGWQSVHDPSALPRVLERWQASIATGQPFEMTFPLRGADGRFRQFLTRVSPVRDSDGRVLRWFGTNTDVEAEHAARSAAEAARAAAEEANKAKSEFLATMSHELRTPLNAIIGYAELLQLGIPGTLTEDQRTQVARILTSARHLLGLINDVLNFAKLEAGHGEYHVTDVGLRAVVDSIEPLVALHLQARGLRFSRHACDDGAAVRADADKLQQILLNLLSNAIKFTPPGGEVTLLCERRGEFVAILVRDTGIGIAADRLGQIFEPFVQVHRRLNSPHEGIGLGLAISRDLALGMGGQLTVDSTPADGSTFTLTLPAAADPGQSRSISR